MARDENPNGLCADAQANAQQGSARMEGVDRPVLLIPKSLATPMRGSALARAMLLVAHDNTGRGTCAKKSSTEQLH